jgi:putative ABC transport system permease protein
LGYGGSILRLADLLRIALSALYQQRGRTLLTTLGVVIGTFILVLSLSIGEGIEQVVLRQFNRYDQLRQIHVNSGYGTREANIPPEELVIKGDMSNAKRERIRKAMIRWWSRSNVRHPTAPLNEERINVLAAIPHVEAVVPFIFQGCRAFFESHNTPVTSCSASPGNKHLEARLLAGQLFETPNDRSVLIHEYLAYLWGVFHDDDVAKLVGRKVRLEFHVGRRSPTMLLTLINGARGEVSSEEEKVLEKAIKQLPATVGKMEFTPQERDILGRVLGRRQPAASRTQDWSASEEFTISGIIREYNNDDPSPGMGLGSLSRDADVFIPVKTVEGLFARAPHYAENGFDSVTVTVDHEENVKEVARQIRAMGLTEFSLVEIFERVRKNVVLMTFATGFVAMIALLVAALGITNTMVMGVLERTREIGIMKAVGARDSHIQIIFLVEGALIGAVGGGLGLLFSWLASFPGDTAARALVEKHAETRLEESLFLFPLWLSVGVPLLAVAIATLAAVYPARRAAKVNPVLALRHE